MKPVIVVSVLICLFWSASAQFNANCEGSRRTIVHLFEWRWDDIAAECERFLGPKGFCGVQVSPPNEHVIVNNEKEKRPWWERYQPVSYKIKTRSGDENAFKDMVKRCNVAGVRIYVDAVINHMAGESGPGIGIAGSPYHSRTLDFPEVPYISNDFHQKDKHCKSPSGGIESPQDAEQIRNCRLLGLVDLDQSKSFVRQKIVAFLNKLIGFGVAGFRFDAAKHMLPADLKMIIDNLDNLNKDWFAENSRPFIYQEVTDLGGEAVTSSEYFDTGRVTEFNYGQQLTSALQLKGSLRLKDLKSLGPDVPSGYFMPSDKALVFVDNHDNQRGHGAGTPVLTFFTPRLYKLAVAFMLAHPYGQAQVMSSYRWERNVQGGKDQNDWMGPPADEQYNIKSVTIDADGKCENDWVCEHRWKAITSMVQFRNIAGDEEVQNWWDNGGNHIAFSRGNKAFFIANAGSQPLKSQLFKTGLKPGTYCDVISGERSADRASCTGKEITVDSDGTTKIAILQTEEEPMIALHIDSILGDAPIPEPTTAAPTAAPETTAPPTVAPETTAPPTVAPETTAVPTVAPETTAPPTVAPETTAPPTVAPESTKVVPETTVAPTVAPETTAPPTVAPETTAPPTVAPESTKVVPETTVAPTVAPETTAPPTVAPETTAVPTVAPETTAPPTVAPETTAPPTFAPETTAPPTVAPETTAPPTVAPETTAPPTVAPETTTVAPETTTPPSYRRTVIFIHHVTTAGQDMFLRGGLTKSSCEEDPSACWVPIRYDHISYDTKHYAGYNTWSKGDNYLNWQGKEDLQSEKFQNKEADGSPMVWTTNTPNSETGPDPAYNVLNTYGMHHWMLDVLMDCSATEDGWFELKGIVSGGWEHNINQDQQCKGDANLSTPGVHKHENHVAKCGFKNVFTWGGPSCHIDNLNA